MSSIARTFFSNASGNPTRLAIWCEGGPHLWGVCGPSEPMVASDGSHGVRRGDHIGVLLPNRIEFVALMLVAADLGAVLVPLSTSLPASAVHRAFRASDVRHVVGTPDTLEGLRSSASWDFSFADGLWLSVGGGVSGVACLEQLLAGVPCGASPALGAQDEDPFILTMTSGATGDPKPIVLTQRSKFNRARAAVELYGVSSADRVLAATPLYHSLAERLVLIPLLTGGSSILMARFLHRSG